MKTVLALALVLFATSAHAQHSDYGNLYSSSPTLSSPSYPASPYATPSYEPPTYRSYAPPPTPSFDTERYNRDYGIQTQREYEQNQRGWDHYKWQR